ncbi:hypothetical protein Tco_1187248 [Tanacetum coccineum]
MQQVQGRQGKIYSSTGYKGNATSFGGNHASGQERVVKCYNCQYEEQLAFLADLGVPDGQAVQKIIPNNAAFQTEDLDAYDSDCDDVSNAKAVLMANISNYGSDVILEVPHSETYLNDMENQSVHAMQDFKQTPVVNFTDNEITSDSNIIPYSQYFQETQQAVEKANKEHNNESVTAELERYKERVKTFEQRLNIDLSSREKMIDSQMDDMIKDKLTLKEQVDSLKQNLSKQIKENESLLQTFTVFKNESKEKENKYMKNEFDLEKKIKELDNIIYKMELSTEQAFWFHMSHPSIESSDASPIKVEVPIKLPKVSLVNESLKKLKFHLAKFESVVKKKTTPDALTEGEWGFEHTKTVFIIEIIPFLKSIKYTFNVFDKDLLNEIMEVQIVFDQMEADVQQCSIDKQCYEIVKKELFLENNRLLQKIMSQDVLLSVMNSVTLNGEYVNVELQRSESCDKCFNLDAEFLKQNAYNDLLKSYSQLEKHCISLELSIQLNQEIFQKDKSCDNQNALELPEYFENNDLKAQLQDKDTTICKLKKIIKSMRENTKEEKVNYDKSEIETINVELENSVAKLLSENERLSKEINHVKQDLKAQIHDKVFVITSLKNNLRKLKGKEIIDSAAQIPSATTIVPGMFKLDLDPLTPRLLQNRKAHIVYLKHTQEQADILRGIVEQAKAKQPLDNALNFACKHAKRIQELLVYVRDTFPNAIKLSAKKVQVKKAKIVESKNANNSKPNHTWKSNATDITSSSSLVNDKLSRLFSVRFWNDHILRIIGYGDYQLGNVIILMVYYVEGLGHNLFSVGQFCDADLEVAFQKNTFFIRNLEGVDLLS